MDVQKAPGGNERRIQVTDTDLERLEEMISIYGKGRFEDACDALDAELANAIVVDSREIRADVVTMNSTVIFEEEGSGQRREMTLVFPRDADPEQGRISILAPVGSALLGLAVGESIDWPLPGGKHRRFRIVEVVYQPEAAGDYEH